jgi:tRNA 2-thiouridine synthesizing protein A
MTIVADQELDCTGMACPMPILKTRKAIDGMREGQVLRLIATDPGSVKDIEAFANKTGNLLLASERNNGKFIFYMQKAH